MNFMLKAAHETHAIAAWVELKATYTESVESLASPTLGYSCLCLFNQKIEISMPMRT